MWKTLLFCNYRKDFLKIYTVQKTVRGKETHESLIPHDVVPRAYVKLTSIFTGTVNFTTICTRGNSSSRATSDRSRKSSNKKEGRFEEREKRKKKKTGTDDRGTSRDGRTHDHRHTHAHCDLHLVFASIHQWKTKNLLTKNSRNNLSRLKLLTKTIYVLINST